MTNHISRSIQEPKRKELSWKERWEGPDNGLIACWERGRDKALEDPELAERAKNGELAVLAWKGGVKKKGKIKQKYGTLNYLATWQGLRGENLDIHVNDEKRIVCTKTKVTVIYTADSSKFKGG